jgi:flagella basal body P-ring formation protein FlgA
MKNKLIFIFSIFFSTSALTADLSEDRFDGELLRVIATPAVNESQLAKLDTELRPIAASIKTDTRSTDKAGAGDVKVTALPIFESYTKDEAEKIPVLVRSIARGKVVNEDDIKLVDAPKNISPMVVLKPEDIIGKEANKILGADRAVKVTDLRKPTIVTKGNHAELSYITNNMELKDLGEVMQDGGVGDLVQVRNVKSGKVLQARVEENGSLSVRLTNGNEISQISSVREPKL